MKSNNLVFKNVLHYVHADIHVKIVKSDNTLFKLSLGANIADFHLLFLTETPIAIKQVLKLRYTKVCSLSTITKSFSVI